MKYWHRLSPIIYLIFFALVALLIILPFLKPGYLFAIDLNFAPKIKVPAFSFHFLSLFYLYRLLNFVFSGEVIEKMIFFSFFFLGGVGMYRLVETKHLLLRIFAGLLYIFNPFVYSRFLDGQTTLLISYSLLPFFLKSLFNFIKNPSWQKAIIIYFWLLGISAIDFHFLLYTLLFFVTFVIFYFAFQKDDKKYRRQIISWSVLIIIIFAFSGFWYKEAQSSTVKFDAKHFIAFRTVSDEKFGLSLNYLSLYGFWGEAKNRFIPLKSFNHFWLLEGLLLLGLAIGGLIDHWEDRDIGRKIKIFGLLALLSLIIIAIHSSRFYTLLTPFKFLREPQKIVVFLIIFYLYSGVIALEAMFDLIKKDKIFQGLAFVLILAIPFSNANGFIKGFRGQFVPTPYPQTWYQVNEILNKDRANFRVWILPWHQYMYFRFAQKVIVNPGPNFFDKPTVGGDNIEFRSEDIYTQSTNPESKYLENLITNGRQITDLGSQIKSHNFKYIILAKEVDWQNYSWLDQQKDLEAIFDSEELKVYQNKSYENK